MTLFFERPSSGERAVLVHLVLRSEAAPEDVREFEELVISAGGIPMEIVMGSRRAPDAKLFAGSGKVDEIVASVAAHGAQLVIFNHNLTPSQERNLEAILCCRVLDRTGLILDIFAQRARTHEGKLQVELAQLQHLSSRLVRGWTHLERQKGGIGMRGPGETQLESDRRLVRARIKSIQKRLLKVRQQRQQGRLSRARAEISTVSLVGYTNAGKSSLFNALTHADVLVADQLFATLDPTMRRVQLEGGESVIFADTVGFISHLPHRLVDAFRATLEEALSAQLLLHVVDVSAVERDVNMQRVDEVLTEIGAREVPTLLVYNKIDLVDRLEPRVDRDDEGKPVAVWISAATGVGLAELGAVVSECLPGGMLQCQVLVHAELASLRAALYNLGAVLAEAEDSSGATLLDLRIDRIAYARLLKKFGVKAHALAVSGKQNII